MVFLKYKTNLSTNGYCPSLSQVRQQYNFNSAYLNISRSLILSTLILIPSHNRQLFQQAVLPLRSRTRPAHYEQQQQHGIDCRDRESAGAVRGRFRECAGRLHRHLRRSLRRLHEGMDRDRGRIKNHTVRTLTYAYTSRTHAFSPST